MKWTFALPLSSRAINSGPPLILLIATSLWLLNPNHYGKVFSLHPERLVMSSPISSSSSSPNSSTTEPLSVGAIQTLPRGDFCEGQWSVGRPGRPCLKSHLIVRDLTGLIPRWLSSSIEVGCCWWHLGNWLLSIDRHHLYGSSYLRGSIFLCLFLPLLRPARRFTFWWFHDGCHPGTQRCFFTSPSKHMALQTFRLICDMFRLCPTPSTFLHYYHPTRPTLLDGYPLSICHSMRVLVSIHFMLLRGRHYYCTFVFLLLFLLMVSLVLLSFLLHSICIFWNVCCFLC